MEEPMHDQQTAAVIAAWATDEPRFELGRTLATPGVLRAVPDDDIQRALFAHHRGQWGDLCAEDEEANERAIEDGDRILSVYTANGVRFWIITEADRSATTVLLPEEY
jgi:hypothetical protein